MKLKGLWFASRRGRPQQSLQPHCKHRWLERARGREREREREREAVSCSSIHYIRRVHGWLSFHYICGQLNLPEGLPLPSLLHLCISPSSSSSHLTPPPPPWSETNPTSSAHLLSLSHPSCFCVSPLTFNPTYFITSRQALVNHMC